MHERKNFIAQERAPFVCGNCRRENADDQSSPRNHCRFCLYSLHVDGSLPGDRMSTCGSVMAPVTVSSDARKGYVITHECTACKKRMNNKAAPDDDGDALIRVSASSAHRSMAL